MVFNNGRLDVKSWTDIAGCTWGLGEFGAILIAFLLEGGYQVNDRSCIGIRLVPMTGGGIVRVKFCEVNHGAGTIELLGFFDPVDVGLLEIC